MPVAYMETIRARYERLGYTPYRWFVADRTPPWQALSKPLSALRLGLLSTSGAYALGQRAYHYKDDTSIREIPATTPRAALRFSHITENYLVDAKRDPNCIFPLDTLRRLVAAGRIAARRARVLVHGRGLLQRRVREETAPAVLDAARRAEIEALLLVAM